MRLLWAGVTLAISLVIEVNAAVAAPRYAVTDLLPSSTFAIANDINNNGEVVFQDFVAGHWRSFFWSPLTGLHEVGDLPGGTEITIAYALNDHGAVVGESGATTGTRAFRWTASQGMIDLGDLPGGGNYSLASDVNNFGQVVGYSLTANGSRAFLWTGASGMSDLGDLPGGAPTSSATAINDQGVVVGYSDTNLGFVSVTHAFQWAEGSGMFDLGDLSGGPSNSSAKAVNELGQTAGTGHNEGGGRPVIWTAGIPQELTVPSDTIFANALGINNLGDVVGTWHTETRTFAALWTEDEILYDLTTLLDSSGAGWEIREAHAINNAGQIVGAAQSSTGGLRAVLLTPVPEASVQKIILFVGLAIALAQFGRLCRLPKSLPR